jgi:hypothetical protein
MGIIGNQEGGKPQRWHSKKSCGTEERSHNRGSKNLTHLYPNVAGNQKLWHRKIFSEFGLPLTWQLEYQVRRSLLLAPPGFLGWTPLTR